MANESYVSEVKMGESFGQKKPPVQTTMMGWLDMELTERCNNNCVHCCINLPAGDVATQKRELSTEQIKNILKEAVALDCMTVRFTGGEPLLRQDFRELYIFARKQGLKVMIFTNATLITPELADLFAYMRPGEKIEVTVYGMNEESYEAVTRVKGSFKAAFGGMNLLLERKVPFVVKGALLPQNKKEMEEFEAWAKTLPWMDKGPSYSMFFDLRCRRDDQNKNRLIKSLRLSAQDGLEVISRNQLAYIKEMQQFCAKFIGPSQDKILSCGSGHNSGCIDAYGFFQPCMMLRHPSVVYDLKKGTLKDAIENFFPKVRETKATNPEYLARCAKCFLKGLCEQCPAKSWSEHGTLDTPVEYLCEIAHAQARFLGLIKDNEKAWEIEDWKERRKEFCEKKTS